MVGSDTQAKGEGGMSISPSEARGGSEATRPPESGIGRYVWWMEDVGVIVV